MNIIERIQKNLFLTIIIFTYILLILISPGLGFESIKNSGYYVKEMLFIMPVIFILTGLLDVWVPKEKIITFLGKESKVKGMILSFIIGSVSAGPVYAAFPMCIMLYNKGASIENLVIILSSWAVIKVPMLLNEVKFLGFKFMVIRWVLTVISIIIFSWIMGRTVVVKTVKEEGLKESEFFIEKSGCIGCGLCVNEEPDFFQLKNRKAEIIKTDVLPHQEERIKQISRACPVGAIFYRKR